MKRKKKSLSVIVLLAAFLVVACSGRHSEKSQSMDMMLEEAPENLSVSEAIQHETDEKSDSYKALSSAASLETTDSKRKFIRTADIRFKASDVIETTYEIEDITLRNGGFITNSQLSSYIQEVKNIDISKDSTMMITSYIVNSYLTLRIPNTSLHETLKEIAQYVDFLDMRTIKANDVSLNLLANELAQERLRKSEKRQENAIENKGDKLKDISKAEETLLQTQERTDQSFISNLALTDQIEFSTITLHVYGNKKIKKELIEKPLEYKEPYTNRLYKGFNSGWNFLGELVIVLSYIWWVILLAILIIIGIKLYTKRKK